MLLILACGQEKKSIPLVVAAQKEISVDSSGIRRMLLQFAISGDSGFLFNREMIPVLAANGLTDLNDSEQHRLMLENDTAGKFYRFAEGRYCCLFSREMKNFSERRIALINQENQSTVLMVSDRFPIGILPAYTRPDLNWQLFFRKVGPHLAIVHQEHGSNYGSETLEIIDPENLMTHQIEIPVWVWESNLTETGYRSVSCQNKATDTMIECRCKLQYWVPKSSVNALARQKTFVLQYHRQNNAWRLIDSSGAKKLAALEF